MVGQWASVIVRKAGNSGLNPDFIAAIIKNESHGDPTVRSRVGAVGPMQVMPFETGFANRPSEEALSNPEFNIGYGTWIMADILRQTDGDAFMAAEGYAGGWDMVGSRATRAYATDVLTDFAAAVAWRKGFTLDPASPAWGLLVTGLDREGRTVLRVVHGDIVELDTYRSLAELFAYSPGLRLLAVETVAQVVSSSTGQQVTGLIYIVLPPKAKPIRASVSESR